jgi:hypothetical protein
MKFRVFWDVAPCSHVVCNLDELQLQRFINT